MDSLSALDKAILDNIFDTSHPDLRMNFDEPISEDANEGEECLDDESKTLVGKAIDLTEDGRYEDALKILDDLLLKNHNSPMILNNRAQVLRLAARNEDALRDLNEAVKLLSNQRGGGGKVVRQLVLCQRGILQRFLGRENEAIGDFEMAAKDGSPFARDQLVALNPYSAMCNAMIQKMIKPPPPTNVYSPHLTPR